MGGGYGRACPERGRERPQIIRWSAIHRANWNIPLATLGAEGNGRGDSWRHDTRAWRALFSVDSRRRQSLLLPEGDPI